MQLTTEQKEELKLLTKHRGFHILEMIVEEKRNALFSQFENLPLNDPKALEMLSGTQNFNKGMKHLIDTAKGLSQKTAKKELDK